MPQVIVAVAASWAASAAGTFLVGLGFAATGFVVTAAKFFVSFAVTALGNKIFGVGGGSGKAPPVPGTQRMETLRSSIASRSLLYGTFRTGATLVYGETTGPDNRYLHIILALGQGQIQGIRPRFWLGDRASDHPALAGRVLVDVRNGSPGQTAFSIPELGSRWTAEHRLAGIPAVYLRLDYSSAAFPNGVPGPTFIVDGVNTIYDPRTGTTGFTNNAALVILDYLRREEGLAAPDHLIDYDSFVVAANICDELVETFENATPGGFERRYTINGPISLDAGPASIINAMESACAGQLVFSGGKYRLYVGAFDYPEVTIDESWLRGQPTIRLAPSRQQQFNTVRGTYVDPLQDWQPADFAEVVNEPQRLADGTEVVQTISYALTTSGSTARRLAKIDLYRNQNASSVQLPLNWSGMSLSLWQTVRLSLGSAPLGDRVYRLVEWTLAEAGGVDITLQEESVDLYEWDVDTDDVPSRSRAALVPLLPFAVVEGLRADLSFNQVNGTYVVNASWDPVRGWPAGVVDYAVEIRLGGEWLGVGLTAGTSLQIPVDEDGLYTVRVRANDGAGQPGTWAYAQTGDGAYQRPGQVQDLTVTRTAEGMVTATWTPTPFAVGGYQVQVRASDQAAWSDLYDTDLTSMTAGTSAGELVVYSPDPVRGISVRVRALGYAGVRGYWSPVKTATL